MPVDYSKWDNLELSDDSDIEVHPNVDKRSFIRAKQNQIHQERQQRRFDIERLKYERIINNGLLKRISSLVAALKAHAHEATSRNPGEVAFQAVMESAGKPEEDQPPKRPEGLLAAEAEENPTYSKMMVALLDQVNKALDEKKPEDRYTAMTEEVQLHEKKVIDLQKQLEAKLAELEQLEKRKITSDAYHTGFDSSFVAKPTAEDKQKEEAAKTGQPARQPELLNPNFKPVETSSKSTLDDEEEEMEASPDAKKFAQFKTTDFRGSAQFISEHPHILKESETDGLMVLAFDAALEKKDEYARQCVHQALLLQYCRQLGRDGVSLFFKRITTKDHQAQQMFYKDVQDTFMRIRNRAREIVRERTLEEEQGGVEQIQLHAVDEGTVINIRIPEKDSQDEEEQRARKIFEGFSEDMRKALESKSLDNVNKVLGGMKVPDAEAMVEAFGEANILSLEEKIIDATTEEGQKQLKELERAAAEEKYDDPE